jgi:hypothetical protein
MPVYPGAQWMVANAETMAVLELCRIGTRNSHKNRLMASNSFEPLGLR